MKIIFKTVVFLIIFVALVVAVLFGTMIAADMSRIRFQSRLKSKVTAEELQAWGANILAPFHTNAVPGDVTTITNLHSAFNGLDKWAPRAYIFADSEVTFNTAHPVAYIKVIYGSAAGHYGVLIGPTNLPSPVSVPHEIKYDTWKPGVWFFNGQ